MASPRLKWVRGRSEHWFSGPRFIIDSCQASPFNVHILKLRKWYIYILIFVCVWSLKGKKREAKLSSESWWNSPASVRTPHAWGPGQSLGWDCLDPTAHSALLCETSGRLSNLSGTQLFNLSKESENAHQHKALWKCVWKSSYVY